MSWLKPWGLLTLCAALCLSVPRARADGDAVSIRTQPRVFAGAGQPSVTVIIHQPILSATLRLTRDDGAKAIAWHVPNKLGEHRFDLPQKVGTEVHFTGALQVQFLNNEHGEIALDFVGQVLQPLQVETQASAEDVRVRRFSVRASRPVSQVKLQLTGEEQRDLGEQTIAILPVGVGATEFVVQWQETSAPVVRMVADFVEKAGQTRRMELFPWLVDVAHEEVVFDSGRWTINASEQPKLDAALARIVTQAKKVSTFAPVKLFVIGHTDTVGSSADNDRLSRMRAAAMASYFRKHGWNLPVLAAGAGERALLQATPDQTDNAANRRAQYVLSIDPPTYNVPLAWQRAP